MRRLMSILLIVAASLMTQAWNCRFGPAPAPNGARVLDIAYFTQERDNWCVPAVVKMWSGYRGQAITQQVVWDWASQHYPAGVSPSGMNARATAGAASHFTGLNIGIYAFSDAQRRQAVADQKRALDQGQPTIVPLYEGSHASLFVGTGWSELGNARPSSDWIKIHDPNPFDGPYKRISTGDWMDITSRDGCGPDCVGNIGIAGMGGAGYQALNEWYYLGGTYYGDPAPPTCSPCSTRPDPPIFIDPSRFVAADVRVIDDRQPSAEVLVKQPSGVRADVYVPYPYTTDQAQVLRNFVAGLRQSKMLESFDVPLPVQITEDDRLKGARLARMIKVENRWRFGGKYFYLLEFNDLAGRSLFRGLVRETGLLGSIEDRRGYDHLILPLTPDEATQRLRSLGYEVKSLRYVWAPGRLDGRHFSEFLPMVVAATNRGELWVTAEHGVYRQISNTEVTSAGATAQSVLLFNHERVRFNRIH